MADKKISALTSATTPLAGTEVLPIVQSGATVKVAVSDLTAGRAISATAVTATTGNFVVGTSGQGLDFSATPGTGTSELLADYEEGTWTPTVSAGTGAILTVGAVVGRYTKIGRQVTITFSATITLNGTGGGYILITGMPFTPSSDLSSYNGMGSNSSTGKSFSISSSSTNIYVYYYDVTYPVASGQTMYGSLVYNV
jgi:hypothetical protein